MAQYIDKSAVVAEIEKRRDESWLGMYTKEKGIIFDITDEILSFLDTLEVKEVGTSNKVIEPTEWSEEDDKMLDSAIGAVYAADYYTYDDKEEIEHWLKSLKQRLKGEDV